MLVIYVDFKNKIVYKLDSSFKPISFDAPDNLSENIDSFFAKFFFDLKSFKEDPKSYCKEWASGFRHITAKVERLHNDGCRIFAIRDAMYLALNKSYIEKYLLNIIATQKPVGTIELLNGGKVTGRLVDSGLPQGMETWIVSATKLATLIDHSNNSKLKAKYNRKIWDAKPYVNNTKEPLDLERPIQKDELKTFILSQIPGGLGAKPDSFHSLKDFEELKWYYVELLKQLKVPSWKEKLTTSPIPCMDYPN